MRKKRNSQCSLDLVHLPHEIHDILSGVSRWLDAHPEFVDWVYDDLRTTATQDTGRTGLSAESVLRIAFLRQFLQFDYDYLAFVLMDSMVFRQFCRLESNQRPKKSSLQSLLTMITASTWEAIQRGQLKSAEQQKIERGRTVAFDSTVTESDIKTPYDSELLAGAVRKMCHLLERGQSFTEQALYSFTHHNRVLRKEASSCSYERKQDVKEKSYKKLLSLTRKTSQRLIEASFLIKNACEKGECKDAAQVKKWMTEVDSLMPLVNTVISQTERRVLHGQKVPAQEKVFSLFEPHTDIIVKDRRAVQYGHKLNLARGKSGLILDLVVETGNPADTDRFIPMVKRQKEIYGRVPRQTAVDGGYASTANLAEAKALGVKDVAFHKKRGLKVEDMTKSQWVYKTLRDFRAGIEGGISWLKRCFGLSRCCSKGPERFDAWCWSAVVACNFVILSRFPPPTSA